MNGQVDSAQSLACLVKGIQSFMPYGFDEAETRDYALTLAHEAGHAVMAMELGIGVTGLTVGAGRASVQILAAPADLPETTRSILEARIYLAGYALSCYFGDLHTSPLWRTDVIHDAYQALEALERGTLAASMLRKELDRVLRWEAGSLEEKTEAIKQAHRAVSQMTPFAPVRSKEAAKKLLIEIGEEAFSWVRSMLDEIIRVAIGWGEEGARNSRQRSIANSLCS
jgi:hypothetical protein